MKIPETWGVRASQESKGETLVEEHLPSLNGKILIQAPYPRFWGLAEPLSTDPGPDVSEVLDGLLRPCPLACTKGLGGFEDSVPRKGLCPSELSSGHLESPGSSLQKRAMFSQFKLRRVGWKLLSQPKVAPFLGFFKY